MFKFHEKKREVESHAWWMKPPWNICGKQSFLSLTFQRSWKMVKFFKQNHQKMNTSEVLQKRNRIALEKRGRIFWFTVSLVAHNTIRPQALHCTICQWAWNNNFHNRIAVALHGATSFLHLTTNRTWSWLKVVNVEEKQCWSSNESSIHVMKKTNQSL